MDGHPTPARGWTESRLQAGSPSTRAFVPGRGPYGPIVAQFPFPSSCGTTSRVRNRWDQLGATKVRLRIWVPTGDGRRRETKVERVPDREHGGAGGGQGGIGDIAEVAERSSTQAPSTVTVAELL